MRLKRLISAFIACAMLVTFMPMQAFATEALEGNLEPTPVTSDDRLVTVQKTAASVDGQEDTYKITLSVKTKDGVTATPAASTDVVLVIDASGSMDEEDKLENAQKAAEDFAKIVLGEEAQGENCIAVVSYAKNASTKCGLSDKLDTVENAIDAITANGGTNIQAGIKVARDLLNGSEADNKVILVLSDGEPTYSFQTTGTARWTGCLEVLGWHAWNEAWYGNGHYVDDSIQIYPDFNYDKVVGSGSGYSLSNGTNLTVSCEHGPHPKSYTYYKNNGDPTIAEAKYAKNAGYEIYSIYLGGKDDTNAQYTMKGIASDNDHFQTTENVDDLAKLFKGIAGSVTTPTSAGIVTDPMGKFIQLDESSVQDKPGVTVTADGFDWDVSKSDPTNNDDGSKTYTLTYQVTVDTDNANFTTGVYPLNDTTTFTYKVGAEAKFINFHVPTVYEDEVRYQVKYEWTGNVPTGVTLPDSVSYLADGAEYTVDDAYSDRTVIEVKDSNGNVTDRYTFSGWKLGDKVVTGKQTINASNVTLTGEWKHEEVTVGKHTVTYKWTGDVPSGVTLPGSVSDLADGAEYIVDSTYTSETVIEVKDEFGNVNGKYTFSGWKLGDKVVTGKQTINASDVTLTGEWKHEEVTVGKHTVTYEWDGEAPTGVTLPGPFTVENNATHEVDIEYSQGYEVKTDEGTYTFSGWDESGTITVTDTITIKGSWKFTPKASAEKKIIVNFNNGGGTWTDETPDGEEKQFELNSDTAGREYNAPQVAAPEGKRFSHWANDQNDTKLDDQAEFNYKTMKEIVGDEGTLTWTAVYAVFEPVSYVAKVTFSVRNGSWNDDTDADIVKEFVLDREDDTYTLTEADIPSVGREPDRGYERGEWRTEPEGAEVGVGEATFVYIYDEKESSGGGAHHPDARDDDDDDNDRDDEDDTEESIDEEVPLAETPWLNTEDHYAYIIGYAEDGTVRPNANITRAEVATIFFRLLTDEARDQFWMTSNNFSDVLPNDWYNNAVSTMVNMGIIQGYEDGTFRPNNNITRAEFAAIASRFMSSGYDVEEDLFTDIANHWARENINDAAMAGWINGYPGGIFLPDQAITRAEAVTLVNNVLQRKPDADHMFDSMIKWPDNPEDTWYYEAIQEATNSHDYDLFEDAEYETWTALQPNRDWAAIEKGWLDAHSA